MCSCCGQTVHHSRSLIPFGVHWSFFSLPSTASCSIYFSLSAISFAIIARLELVSLQSCAMSRKSFFFQQKCALFEAEFISQLLFDIKKSFLRNLLFCAVAEEEKLFKDWLVDWIIGQSGSRNKIYAQKCIYGEFLKLLREKF